MFLLIEFPITRWNTTSGNIQRENLPHCCITRTRDNDIFIILQTKNRTSVSSENLDTFQCVSVPYLKNGNKSIIISVLLNIRLKTHYLMQDKNKFI